MVMPCTREENSTFVGEGVGFDRLRRITGYLVGTLDRWNNSKKAEERDRVKHVQSDRKDKS
jgi:anaerobic ribonucleoside-triphosphate reductase